MRCAQSPSFLSGEAVVRDDREAGATVDVTVAVVLGGLGTELSHSIGGDATGTFATGAEFEAWNTNTPSMSLHKWTAFTAHT